MTYAEKSYEIAYTFFGASVGSPRENTCISELPGLDFLQFRLVFAHFQTKRDFY